MRHATRAALAAWLLIAGSSEVRAQVLAQPTDRLHFAFGGGYTVPNSEVRDLMGNGYNLLFGVQYDVTRFIAIEGFLSANELGDKQLRMLVSPAPFTASIPTQFAVTMSTQLATANLVVQKPAGWFRPYGLVGVGVYDRPVQLTTPGVGFVPGFCDPLLYVCFSGGFVPVDNVVGDRSSTDFGMDVGGGLNFTNFLFVEARYHYIWGPTIEATRLDPAAPAPVARKANGRFLATSFGVRF